jgi:hypothetical protein
MVRDKVTADEEEKEKEKEQNETIPASNAIVIANTQVAACTANTTNNLKKKVKKNVFV